MYFRVHYIIPIERIAVENFFPVDDFIVLSVSKKQLAHLNETYKKIPEHTKCCFLLQEPSLTAVWHELASFTFLPGYLREKGKPVILFTKCGGAAEEDCLAIQHWPQQAYYTIRWIDIPLLITESEELNQTITNYYTKDEFFNSTLYIQPPNPDYIRKCDNILKLKEAEYKSNFPALYFYKSELFKQIHIKSDLESILLASHQEIENARDHLQILRSESQARRIQDHYDKVYESLPKWYKKIGSFLRIFKNLKN